MDRATAAAKIAEIDEILDRGAKTVQIADRIITYDFEILKERRSRLYAFLQGGRVRVGRYNINQVP